MFSEDVTAGGESSRRRSITQSKLERLCHVSCVTPEIRRGTSSELRLYISVPVMGGSDINKKKSWDPARKVNQEKVWKAERQALEERKRIEEKRKEIAESRRAEELQRLQNAAKATTAVQKLEWMYTPVATDSLKISPEMESYLLGTKKTTKVVANAPMCVGGGTGQREEEKLFKDTLNLVREDPLLAVKKEELLEEKRSQQMASEIKSEHQMEDVERYRSDDRDKRHMKRKREEKYTEERCRRARRHRGERKRNHLDDNRRNLKK